MHASIESTYLQHFSIGKISEAGKSYQSQEFLNQNPAVIAALSASQDAVMQALEDFSDYHNRCVFVSFNAFLGSCLMPFSVLEWRA